MNAPGLSSYQGFKIWLLQVVEIDRDALHVLLGAAIVLALLALLRDKSGAVVAGLIIAGLAGVAMEALDLRDAWRAGEPFDWAHSADDLLRTVLVPMIVLFWAASVTRRDP